MIPFPPLPSDNFSERLRFWRISKNFTQAEAAQHLDIDRSYLSQVERGRPPGNALRTRFLLVEQTEASPSTIRLFPSPAAQPGPRHLPLISWIKAAQIQEFLAVPSEWEELVPGDLPDEKAFAVRLRSDAMEPKISDRDVALLSPSETPRNGEIVVANLKGEGLVCRLMHLQQERSIVKLSSYNPAYPPLEYRREEFYWIFPVVTIVRHLRPR